VKRKSKALIGESGNQSRRLKINQRYGNNGGSKAKAYVAYQPWRNQPAAYRRNNLISISTWRNQAHRRKRKSWRSCHGGMAWRKACGVMAWRRRRNLAGLRNATAAISHRRRRRNGAPRSLGGA